MSTKDKIALILGFDGVMLIVFTLLRIFFFNPRDQQTGIQISIVAVLFMVIGAVLLAVGVLMGRGRWGQINTAKVDRSTRTIGGPSLTSGGLLTLTGVTLGPLWQEQPLTINLIIVTLALGLILFSAWLYIGLPTSQAQPSSNEQKS